jgi:hypothetical protein
MAERKNNDKKPSKKDSAEDKKLKAIYAKGRKEFSAADLQKFTVIEEGIPLKQVIAEMKAIHRETNKKKA